MKKQSLNITFHNPNIAEEVVKELIKISAQVAKTKVSEILLHMKQDEAIVD